MLSSRMTHRRRSASWTRRLWGRLLAVFLLSFAVPGGASALADAVAAFAGLECCDDDCDAEDKQDCSMSRTDCACCMHLGAVAVVLPDAVEFVLGRPTPSDVTYGFCHDGPYASGYRTPPFRPPLA